MVLHSAMATVAETNVRLLYVCMSCNHSRQCRIPALGLAVRSTSPGQGDDHWRAGSGEAAGEQKHIAAVFPGGYSLCRHAALLLGPGSSHHKMFFSQHYEYLRN